MQKAVIYARQSSGDEEQSESIDVQIAKCREVAEKEGLKVIGTFSDLNTSGRTYPAGSEAIAAMDATYEDWFNHQTKIKKFRKGLGDAITKIQKEKCSLVIYDLTRLYRPVSGSFLESRISQLLKDVKIYTVVGGQIDLNEFSSSLVASITNRINDNQLQTQKRKSREGLDKAKDDGRWWCGKRIFGYQMLGGKFFLDSLEGPLLCEAFKMAADGLPLVRICTYLNNRRDGHITIETLKRILRRSQYIGKTKDSKGNLIDCQGGLFDRYVIDKGVWLKVQTRLDATTTPKRAKVHEYPLAGYMYCGYCGRAMNIAVTPLSHRCKKQGEVIRYKCPHAPYDATGKCALAKIKNSVHPATKIGEGKEIEVYNPDTFSGHGQRTVATMASEEPETNFAVGIFDAVLPLLAGTCLATINDADRPEAIESKINDLKVQKKSVADRRQGILDMVGKGLITIQDAETTLADIKKNMMTIDGQLADLEGVEAKAGKIALQKAFARLEALRKGELPYADFRELVKKVIEQIRVFDKYVTITFLDGTTVKIAKNKYMHIKAMPQATLEIKHFKDGRVKAIVKYWYQSVFAEKRNDDEVVLLDTPELEIRTIGKPTYR